MQRRNFGSVTDKITGEAAFSKFAPDSVLPGQRLSLALQNLVQFALIYLAGFGNQTGGFVTLFLYGVAGMAARPLPGNAVPIGGGIQPRPEFVIGFAPKLAIHGFDDILRVGNDFDLARFAQGFQRDTGGDDFRLLVGAQAEKFADDAALATIFQNGSGSGACGFAAIAQTAAVANDVYLFHYRLSACFSVAARRS